MARIFEEIAAEPRELAILHGIVVFSMSNFSAGRGIIPATAGAVTPMHLVSGNVIRLTEVPEGSTVRVVDTHLDAHSREQLRSLGVTATSAVRVCKQGEPCVLQVRTTRIGISGSIARQLLVLLAGDESRETPCR